MYRTGDPRFRRRLNELGSTLSSANESAQSQLYLFGQNYVSPCLGSVTDCFRTCVDASCPTLNLNASQRDRLRRQRGRGRSRTGRAELSFDFYDDWDDDGADDAFMGGWGAGEDEFDRLLSGSQGYGTLGSSATKGLQQTQPGRQRTMSYPKARRKSTLPPHDGGEDPTVIPASSGFFARLFGGKGKGLRYKPSAADLQEHPGARHRRRDLTEGEALLSEISDGDEDGGGRRKQHRRVRSNTATSGDTTTDSLSSRGDIFPSDEEDDAIPLDDEFAMVLERRTTIAGGGGDTETTSSGRTRRSDERRKGKRPSAGSRRSTVTVSSRSRGSSRKSRRSRANSSAAQTVMDEALADMQSEDRAGIEVQPPSEPKQEETLIARPEEANVFVTTPHHPAQKLGAEEREPREETAGSSKGAPTPRAQSPQLVQRGSDEPEPSQLPTPLATDDEEDGEGSRDSAVVGHDDNEDKRSPE